MTVTSAQVAKVAGVSRATVSFVLNDVAGQTISAATRENVLRVARELGYRPNANARSLRTGRGSTVLFPLPALQHTHVVTRLVDACSAALTAAGWSLVTDFTEYDGVDAQLDAWSRVSPAAVIDGLLRHDDPVLEALRRQGVVVLSAALPSDSRWESTSDAMARATRETQLRYLLDQGARDISLVLPTWLPVDPRVERRLLRRLSQLGAKQGAAVVVDRCELSQPAVSALVDGWLDGDRPDAVAAYNDDYALAVLTALAARGVRIPDEVRVMGVDDVPLAAVVSPPLTTIAADFDDYAGAIARVVETVVAGDPTADVPPLPVPQHRLVVRASA